MKILNIVANVITKGFKNPFLDVLEKILATTVEIAMHTNITLRKNSITAPSLIIPSSSFTACKFLSTSSAVGNINV